MPSVSQTRRFTDEEGGVIGPMLHVCEAQSKLAMQWPCACSVWYVGLGAKGLGFTQSGAAVHSSVGACCGACQPNQGYRVCCMWRRAWSTAS